MSEARVIAGTYSDFKIIRTRSVVQFIVEFPIEQAAKIVADFGVPQPGAETHVAIARLQDGLKQPEKADSEPSKEPERKPKSRAQMSGMLCNERSFQLFLEAHLGENIPDGEAAAWAVRKLCIVESRSLLDTDTDAGFQWNELLSAYRRWQLEPSCGVPAS